MKTLSSTLLENVNEPPIQLPTKQNKINITTPIITKSCNYSSVESYYNHIQLLQKPLLFPPAKLLKTTQIPKNYKIKTQTRPSKQAPNQKPKTTKKKTQRTKHQKTTKNQTPKNTKKIQKTKAFQILTPKPPSSSVQVQPRHIVFNGSATRKSKPVASLTASTVVSEQRKWTSDSERNKSSLWSVVVVFVFFWGFVCMDLLGLRVGRG